MAQDIAVRLANEGMPIRAIARAVGLPSADVREALESARAQGFLIDIPCEDWPPGYPRDRRVLELVRVVTPDAAALQSAVRSIFKLALAQALILLVLLSYDEVARQQLVVRSDLATRTGLSRLRAALEPFELNIETIYGYGYHMPPAHRRKAVEMIGEHMGVSAECARAMVCKQSRLMLRALRSGEVGERA